MIARIALLLGITVLVGCRSTMNAQELREVDGQKYIAHKVLKGQTLFAISRHYAVPVGSITGNNPGTDHGISVGQVLLIPVKAQVKKELKSAPALMDGELAHTVRKKETLYGIARSYGVDPQELMARNPNAAGLKVGSILIIPIAHVTTQPAAVIAPAVEDQSDAHLVQPGETIFSLSKRYDIPVEDIQSANGGLPQGLKAGTYVRIPAKKTLPEPVAPPVPVHAQGSLFKVALLLPFCADENDSAQAHQRERKGMYKVTDAAVQFYAGARMALDSLGTLGLNADLTVMDVGEDAHVWDQALKDRTLKDEDLCIGPFHRAAIEKLSRLAPAAHIVCPVPQTNKVLLGNPNVSKVVGGRPDQVQQMARYVAYRHARDNIILCMPEIASERELREQVSRALREALADVPGKLRDSVLVASVGKRDPGDVIAKLSSTAMNVVVVPSEEVEFVTQLVKKLADAVPSKRITLFGLNSWTEMETLEPAELEALNTCVPASTWIDRDDPRVRAFITDFRERFQNEPGDYAFLGFDVTFFYLSALMQQGRSFPEHFGDVVTRPLHMSFDLRRAGEENGFRNENALMLRYTAEGLRKAQ